MKTIKFSNDINADFAATLQSRVNNFFNEKKISRNANAEMVLKTIMAMAMYLVPFICMLIFDFASVPLMFGLWVIMGFGQSFIGMAVMHDGLHGSYSKNEWINKLIGSCTWIIGVDPQNWKIQHNVLHHTYTNVDHVDEDIEPRFIFRFSPNQPKNPIQKYQHIYAFFFYGLSTIIWVTLKDFVKAVKYKNEKLVKSGTAFQLHMLNIVLRKIVYFSLFLVLPGIVLSQPFWLVTLMFLSMLFTSGFILTFIFQCAHVMETSEFTDGSEEDKIKDHRLVHQLKTTSNFGVNSNLLFWFSGGLNHQIEHHLFPNICHIHYRKISKIVRETAADYGLPYHTQSSLYSAVAHHLKMLKTLGTPVKA